MKEVDVFFDQEKKDGPGVEEDVSVLNKEARGDHCKREGRGKRRKQTRRR